MLKTAHLIVAFKNPKQLERLVKSLQHPDADVFIHIDQKVNIEPFMHIADIPRVHFIKKRHYVVWGGYSITECYIDGMAEIMQHDSYDYVLLMSGQDYPLRPVDEFHRYLRDQNGYSIMSVQEKNAESKWWSLARDRYRFYHLNDFRFFGKKLIHKISKRLLPERQFIFPSYKLFGGPGATFCALTREAALYIVNFTKENRKAARFAKFTNASDEFWFQTLLMNSPLRDKVINEPLWYIDWNGRGKHPRVLTALDYPSLISSGLFFARKFDMYVDESIFDMLDIHFSERRNLRVAFTR